MTPILLATLAAALLTLQPPAPPADPKKAPTPPAPDKAPAPVVHDETWPFTADLPTEIGKGYKFNEGPTWVPGADKATGSFIFCDMGDNKVFQIVEGKDKPVIIRPDSGNAVGSIADDKGVVYQVETAGRRIIKWSLKDGAATEPVEVASKFEGGPLGGMNDLAIRKADGSLYVTHADWFLNGGKTPFIGVLRIAPDGATSRAADGLAGPNGICFSPDGKTLYVNEYGAGRVNAFPVKDDGTLGEKKVIADMNAMAKEHGLKGQGGADGCHTDTKGNIFTTGPAGIWVLSPEGKFIAHLPFRGTNIAFGGPDMKTLLITTNRGLAKIGVKTPGTR